MNGPHRVVLAPRSRRPWLSCGAIALTLLLTGCATPPLLAWLRPPSSAPAPASDSGVLPAGFAWQVVSTTAVEPLQVLHFKGVPVSHPLLRSVLPLEPRRQPAAASGSDSDGLARWLYSAYLLADRRRIDDAMVAPGSAGLLAAVYAERSRLDAFFLCRSHVAGSPQPIVAACGNRPSPGSLVLRGEHDGGSEFERARSRAALGAHLTAVLPAIAPRMPLRVKVVLPVRLAEYAPWANGLPLRQATLPLSDRFDVAPGFAFSGTQRWTARAAALPCQPVQCEAVLRQLAQQPRRFGEPRDAFVLLELNVHGVSGATAAPWQGGAGGGIVDGELVRVELFADGLLRQSIHRFM